MSERQRWIGGVDEPLPEGEEILWSGSPDARAVSRHVMHLRVWGAYMAGLTVLVGISAASSLPVADAARVVVFPLLLAAVVLGSVAYFARLVARTSTYVITSQRIVLQVGIAFPIAINIPLRLVDEAGLRMFRDGTGEIRLTLSPEVKLAYIALWPHVEVFRNVAHPRPKLRGLVAPDAVGAALRGAIAANGGAVQLGDVHTDPKAADRTAPRYGATSKVMAR